MLGVTNRSDLSKLSPARRYLEKSRRYHMERQILERRRQAHLQEVAPSEPSVSEPDPVKGQCRYCGKPMKRGLHFHERACRQSQT